METDLLFPHYAQYHLSVGIMKRISLVLTTLLLLFAAGCSEIIMDRIPNVHLRITGTVVDYETGVPVEGLQVILTEIRYSAENPVVPPVYTDAKGAYHFEYTGTPLQYAYIMVNMIDFPGYREDYAEAAYAFRIDYNQTRMEPTADSWDFGTVEIQVPPIRQVPRKPETE